ncbi:MAG: glycerol kinase GlpK [Pseudomonadota bacterium]
MADTLIALDQGTTSSRAMVFNTHGQPLAAHQQPFPQMYPADGWVEHDPEAIWSSTVSTAKAALAGVDSTPTALGITNQRETVVIWDRATGAPIHNALVWQDRRTAPRCAEIEAAGHGTLITERTGLLIDPYFSATKLTWLLDHVPGARARAMRGELAAGTIDSFLIWRLTGGRVHATDATNASRTSLFDIHLQKWDEDLLQLFGIPSSILPDVKDSAADFGTTDPDVLGAAIPIRGVAGDQQAAAIGQACFRPGDLKSTYGTGCFVIVNTGEHPIMSQNRLLTTLAYRLNGKPTYALEGSIFIAGAAVQWLRDEVGVLASAAETAERAARARDDAQVIMVPAFTGMGAPHWAPDARAAVFGMTRDTGPNELSRAALEGVVYQTHDLFAALAADGRAPSNLRVDGGMVANDWFVQRLADVLNLNVLRPTVLETTALGAAYLAGLGAGIYTSLEQISGQWQAESEFSPDMDEGDRATRLKRWQACVDAVLSVAAS